MRYNQVEPSPLLKDFIRCYWWLDNSTDHSLDYTIFPDGCFDLILYFRGLADILGEHFYLWTKSNTFHR